MLFPKNGLALAPMRALTQPPFWRVLNRYGAPDAYFSEFVRVHENYVVETEWIEASLEAAEGHPLWIQLMGNDSSALAASVHTLEKYPIAGIDFNVGCPIPKIFKKQAGGGLLRDLPFLRELLLNLRAACSKPLSVKFRLGFDSSEHLEAIIQILNEAKINLATLHARTVRDLYRGKPRYDLIQRVVPFCSFPLLANGSINDLEAIADVLKTTQCHGVMLGRAAVCNPWIFSQWHALQKNEQILYPKFCDVFHYLEAIFEEFHLESKGMLNALGCMKRFANYVGLSVDPQGDFLKQMRRTQTLKQFWKCCADFLLTDSEKIFTGKIFESLLAQPNKESECGVN